MRSAPGAARKGVSPAKDVSQRHTAEALVAKITEWLDETQASYIVHIDIAGKSSLGDFMVIASGTSDRHVGAIADRIQRSLRELGRKYVQVEGTPHCDWVLIDAGDVVVHVFRPEVRAFYNLEKMWSADRPPESLVS